LFFKELIKKSESFFILLKDINLFLTTEIRVSVIYDFYGIDVNCFKNDVGADDAESKIDVEESVHHDPVARRSGQRGLLLGRGTKEVLLHHLCRYGVSLGKTKPDIGERKQGVSATFNSRRRWRSERKQKIWNYIFTPNFIYF